MLVRGEDARDRRGMRENGDGNRQLKLALFTLSGRMGFLGVYVDSKRVVVGCKFLLRFVRPPFIV